MRKNGKTKAGAQKYRCSCGFNSSDSDRPPHRPLIADTPLTQVELNKRYRAKKRKKKKE
jgi:transposase-like protein